MKRPYNILTFTHLQKLHELCPHDWQEKQPPNLTIPPPQSGQVVRFSPETFGLFLVVYTTRITRPAMTAGQPRSIRMIKISIGPGTPKAPIMVPLFQAASCVGTAKQLYRARLSMSRPPMILNACNAMQANHWSPR